MARLRVLTCLLSRVVRQYGPVGTTSDLLGVDYFPSVPADTEFPYQLGTFDLFTRFLSTGGITGRVLVTVVRLRPDGSDWNQVYWKWVPLPVIPGPGPLVLDTTFRLHRLVVPGEGTYVARVSRDFRRRWDRIRRTRVLGSDSFAVLRAT
ncbi:MAG TPA: hypothetical protein VD866_13545 [Urbifossiella sp.]|nr:hypothetical protein [Urbifossiella sp.]